MGLHATCKNFTQNEGVVVYSNTKISLKVEEPDIIDANCLILKIDFEFVVVAIYRPPGKY